MNQQGTSQSQRVLVARIFGGLGNQLFIYAAAKRLAQKNNATLKLDILSGYSDDPYNRSYCLRYFDIREKFASPMECYMTEGGKRRRYWARKINKLLPFRYRFYIEQDRPFDQKFLDFQIRGRLYLQGYWQDERYFSDIEDFLRERLIVTVPHEQENLKMAEAIASQENAVCLHARRHDYEHALPPDYYRSAIDYLVKRVENPHFFCFSDTPEWFRAMEIPFPLTIISHNSEEKNYEDLWLMSLCRHYIIANSTFSWWGAWLNPKPDKIVIAPARWGYDTAIPKGWIAL